MSIQMTGNWPSSMDTLFRASLLIIAAFVAWGLWLGEVCWAKGWAGLAWLDGFNWSALPICAVIVVTSSCIVSPGAAWRERILFVLVGFALTAGAFVAGRRAVIEIGSAWVSPFFDPFVTLAVAGLAVSVGLTAATGRWLAPVHVWTVVAVIVALVLVLPLSFVTIIVFPALNGDTGDIHAIKMGYPVLWTALLVPLALRLGRKRRHAAASDAS
jgi:hypothetical protein